MIYLYKRVELLHVIDAFDVPKSIYCEQTKKLVKYVLFLT